jgi:type I restriction enzyme S subunit
VLIPGSTTTVARDLAIASALNEDGVLLGGDINILRKKDSSYDANLLAYYLTHYKKEEIGKLGQGSTIVHLYGSNIKNLEVVIPKNIDEQEKIAKILGTVDENIEKIQKVIEAIEKLKRGLMQQLFTRGIGHTKFKETKIGPIPEGWEVVTIQNLIDRKIIIGNQDGNHGGIHPKASDYVSGGIPFISASDVREGRVDLKNCHFLSEEHAKKLRIGFAKENDVLLTHKGSVGNVAIVPKLNTDYIVLTPQVTYYRLNKDLLDGGYLSYVFQSDYFQSLFKSSSRQSTRDFLSITNQRKLMIPFTKNLNEQQKIANILSAADEKISVNKKLKEKLTLLKKGLMQDLLSGKVRTNL